MPDADDPQSQGPDHDLQFDEAPIAGLPKSPQWRGGRIWRGAVVIVAAAAIIAAMLVTGSPLHEAIFGPLATPTATRVPFPSPTAIPLGAVPTTCPPGQPVTTFAPAFGPGVGEPDLNVWLVGFDGPEATLHLANDPHTSSGWSHKLLVVAGSEVTQPITLSASVVTIGLDPVLFSADVAGGGGPSIGLEPAAVPPQNGWRTWPLYITVRAAGCYFFQIQSGTSMVGWYFAAGR